VTELERLDLTIADVLAPRSKEISMLLGQLMVRARLRRFQQNVYDQLDPIINALQPLS